MNVVTGQQENIMNAPASISAVAAVAAVTGLAAATLVPAPAAASSDSAYSGGEHSSAVHRVTSEWRPHDGSYWYVHRYGPYQYGYGPSYHYYDPRYYGIRAVAPPDVPPPDALPPGPPAANPNCLSKSYLQDGTVVFTDNCTNETATSAPAQDAPPPARRWRGVEK
jgi:hypothetical protein